MQHGYQDLNASVSLSVLSTEIEDLEHENKELREKNLTFKEMNNSLRLLAEKLQERDAASTALIEALRSDCEISNHLQQMTEQAYDDLASELHTSKCQIEELRFSNNENQVQQAGVLKRRLDETNIEIAELRNALNVQNEKIRNLERELVDKNQDIRVTNNLFHQLVGDVSGYHKSCMDLQAALETETSEKIEQLHQRLSGLSSAVVSAVIATSSESIVALDGIISEEDICLLMSMSRVSIINYIIEIKKLIALQDNDLSLLASDHEQLRKELADTKELFAQDIQKQFISLNREQHLVFETVEYKKVVDALDNCEKKLSYQQQQQARQYAEATQVQARLEFDILTLGSSLDRLRLINSKLISDVSMSSAEVQRYKSYVDKCDRLQHQLHQQQLRFADYEEVVRLKNQEIIHLQQQSDLRYNTIAASKDEEVSALERLLADCNANFASCKSTSEQLQRENESIRRDRDDEIEVLQKQIQYQDDEIGRMKLQLLVYEKESEVR